jgi:hypothetical protein
MVQGNMSFNATNLKGSGYVDGTPVFSKQLPLTRGGVIGEVDTGAAKFGYVVSAVLGYPNIFIMGIDNTGSVSFPVGILIADPSIMMNDPTMNNYYYAGRPATAVTFGLVQIYNYATGTTGLIPPVFGAQVVCNTTTGQIGFIASGATAPSGYAIINASVYNKEGPNGVTIFVNYPLANSGSETPATVATPTASPVTASTLDISSGTNVVTLSSTNGATIYYTMTTNGSTPADPTTASVKYTAPIVCTVAGTTAIKAIAVKYGMVNSAIATLSYTVQA